MQLMGHLLMQFKSLQYNSAHSSICSPEFRTFSLAGVLGVLADPLRLRIVGNMLNKNSCMSCSEAMPCQNMAKSTLSHHFRILREAGLIRTKKVGVENRNVLRTYDINVRFPDLMNEIMKYSIY